MKKSRMILTLCMAAALSLSLFAGCASDSDTTAGGTAAAQATSSQTATSGSAAATTAAASLDKPVVDINNGDKATIAYIPMSSGQEDFAVIQAGMQEALGMYPNVTLDTYDAGFDATKQIDLINECVTQGVKAIIINSMDSTALNSTIADAEAAGVTVISLNNGCSGIHTGHIMNTDYQAGYDAAKYIDGVAGADANVVILDVNAALKPTCRMGTGFEDYISETGHMKELEDVAQDLTNVENGYNATAEMLSKYDNIDVIYCVNDNSAIGAYQAVAAAGRENDGIIIWGYSGTPAALDAIAKGQITGTSYSDPYFEGYAAIVTCLYDVQTGYNAASAGLGFFPSVVLPTTIVTKDNVLDIIAKTHWDMSAYNY